MLWEKRAEAEKLYNGNDGVSWEKLWVSASIIQDDFVLLHLDNEGNIPFPHQAWLCSF